MYGRVDDRNRTEDVVRAQLVLRAVVWDVSGVGREESAKLYREMALYEIQKLDVTCGRAGIGDVLEKYEKMQESMCKAEIVGSDALLISDDAGLVNEMHHLNQEMAVVYYEKTDGRNQEEVLDGRGYAKPAQELKAGAADKVIQELETGVADMIVQGLEEVGVQFLDRVLKRKRKLPWNILYTRRTCVQEISLSDLDELYELYAGEGITDYTEPLFERAEEEEYTKSYIACMYYYYGYGMWIVRERETGKLIGRAGIEHREEGTQVLMELGYIIRREYQNKGYATEVCQAILEYAAFELEMEQMHCFIHPNNVPSIRVAEKLGFHLCSDQACRDGMLHYLINFHS